MFIALKSLLRTLILPPAGPLILALAGALLLARRAGGTARRVAWTFLVAGLALLWALSTPAVAEALSRLAVRYPALDPSQPVNAQAIVILGGSEVFSDAPEYGGAAVGLELLGRVSYGAYLARRSGLPVLVSGVDEALPMSTVLARDFGIRARWVEDRSRDTFENARFSARLLEPQGVRRILLVTSADHEWRAAHEFASAGFTVEPAPVSTWAPRTHGPAYYTPEAHALLQSSSAVYEILGDLARRVFAATHLRTQGR